MVSQLEAQLREQQEHSAAQVTALAGQLEEAQAEAAALRQAAEAAHAEHQRLEAATRSLGQQLQQAQQDATAAREQRLAEQQHLLALQEEQHGLQQGLRGAIEQIEGLSSECEALAAQLEAAQQQAQVAEAAHRAAAQGHRAELDSLQSELAQRAQQVTAQQAELQSKAAALAEGERTAGQLREALEEAAGFVDAAERELEALRLSLRLSSAERTQAQEEAQVGLSLADMLQPSPHRAMRCPWAHVSLPQAARRQHAQAAAPPCPATGCVQLARAELAGLRLEHDALSRRWACIQGSDQTCRWGGPSVHGRPEAQQLAQACDAMPGLARSMPVVVCILRLACSNPASSYAVRAVVQVCNVQTWSHACNFAFFFCHPPAETCACRSWSSWCS